MQDKNEKQPRSARGDKIVGVRFPADERAWLTGLSATMGVSISDIVRGAARMARERGLEGEILKGR